MGQRPKFDISHDNYSGCSELHNGSILGLGKLYYLFNRTKSYISFPFTQLSDRLGRSKVLAISAFGFIFRYDGLLRT